MDVSKGYYFQAAYIREVDPGELSAFAVIQSGELTFVPNLQMLRMKYYVEHC